MTNTKNTQIKRVSGRVPKELHIQATTKLLRADISWKDFINSAALDLAKGDYTPHNQEKLQKEIAKLERTK